MPLVGETPVDNHRIFPYSDPITAGRYKAGLNIALLFIALSIIANPAVEGNESHHLPEIFGMLAAILGLTGMWTGITSTSHRLKGVRSAWLILAIGAACILIGNSLALFPALFLSPSQNISLGDVFHWLAVPFLAAAALILPKKKISPSEKLNISLDIGIILLVSGLVYWMVTADPTSSTRQTSWLTALEAGIGLSVFLALVWTACLFAYWPFRRRARLPLAWMFGSLAAYITANILDVMALESGQFSSRYLPYILYSTSSLMIMLGGLAQSQAGIYQQIEQKPSVIHRSIIRLYELRHLWPYGLLILAYIMLFRVAALDDLNRFQSASLGVAAISFLVILRQLFSITDNKRLSNHLNDSYSVMERRVRERTAELERANEELLAQMRERRRIETALLDREEKLAYSSLHDALTGLGNRNLLIRHTDRALQRARRSENFRFSVLFIDLDGFKVINDSLGHEAGDQLLVYISKRLRSCLRELDLTTRLGGDEFAILIDQTLEVGDATAAADRILQALSTPFDLHGTQVYLTASIGIVIADGYYLSPNDILRDADLAMYEAKSRGKSRYQIFDKSLGADALQRMILERDMRQALEREEFVLHYQPIMSLDNHEIVGFEALVRWNHAELGLVPPVRFIPLAESNGLILPLTVWVLRKACLQAREWQNMLARPTFVKVSVNLSARLLRNQDFPEIIEQILKETRLPAHCLSLEITESAIADDMLTTVNALNKWRSLGIEVHLDDFGKGYSALSYLQTVPLDTLKIDRGFVSRIGSNGENLEVIRTIVSLARELGLHVIAEGVETADQMQYVRQIGCELAQGFYFYRPMEAEKVLTLLNKNYPELKTPRSGRRLAKQNLVSPVVD